MVFCTLFDSNYLDKGIVMYRSMIKLGFEFKLYILAMDDKCYEILGDLNLTNVYPIKLSDFETPELIKAKGERSKGEYCFTCTPFIIDYVIKKYNEKMCTYIDSDLYFFSDPTTLLLEMNENQSVQIIKHNFNNNLNGRRNEKHSGVYCVEFNTFKNENKAMSLLKVWQKQCLDGCSLDAKKGEFGDQKYLDEWTSYAFVNVIENTGAGIAPWNIDRYKTTKNDSIVDKVTNKEITPVFYHFHAIYYLNENSADINVFKRYIKCDKNLVNQFYAEYFKETKIVKKDLFDSYNWKYLMYNHPVLAVQKKHFTLSPIKIFFYIRNKIITKINRKKDIFNF